MHHHLLNTNILGIFVLAISQFITPFVYLLSLTCLELPFLDFLVSGCPPLLIFFLQFYSLLIHSDYRHIPELDVYDRDNLDDSEYSMLSEGDRMAAEAQMRKRDRDEGRPVGGMRRGFLYGE